MPDGVHMGEAKMILAIQTTPSNCDIFPFQVGVWQCRLYKDIPLNMLSDSLVPWA